MKPTSSAVASSSNASDPLSTTITNPPPTTTNSGTTDSQQATNNNGWFYKLRKDGGVIDRVIMFMFLIQMIAVFIWILLTLFVGMTSDDLDNLKNKEKPPLFSIVKPTLRYIRNLLLHFGININFMVGDEL